MALSDKNLIITPNIGSSNEPKIDFVGASTNTGPSTITATVYPTNNGTLSFDGTAGNLFSITNNLASGSIFSVNPISGIPIIDVNADRTIALNPYGGNTGIGLTNPTSKLQVTGNVSISGVTTSSGGFVGNLSGNINSTGVSTFTNGPVLIGSGTSTGTASQRLQVTGGAYVSGSVGIGTTNPIQSVQIGTGNTVVVIDALGEVGIGTTNPTAKLQVIGDANISGVITASNFSGNISGNVNSTGVSTFTDIRLNSVSEKSIIISGNTVNLVYNTGGGNVAICTNPTGPITLNVTGIPTDISFDNRTLTFTVVAIQTSIGYACTTVNLNGVARTVRYPGGVISVGSTSSYDIFNFTGINTVGSGSTTANYQVLGLVNGNFK